MVSEITQPGQLKDIRNRKTQIQRLLDLRMSVDQLQGRAAEIEECVFRLRGISAQDALPNTGDHAKDIARCGVLLW